VVNLKTHDFVKGVQSDDYRGYAVGAFRVIEDVNHNLLKPIMSLGIPLSEIVEEPR